MLPQLDTYDWEESFKYAVRSTCSDGSNVSVTLPSVGLIAPFDFSREDVVEIYAMQDGKNDGPPWIIYGRLQNNYYFYLEAGCDYTGWG